MIIGVITNKIVQDNPTRLKARINKSAKQSVISVGTTKTKNKIKLNFIILPNLFKLKPSIRKSFNDVEKAKTGLMKYLSFRFSFNKCKISPTFALSPKAIKSIKLFLPDGGILPITAINQIRYKKNGTAVPIQITRFKTLASELRYTLRVGIIT